MAKFRKRPIVVEAIQWDGGNDFEVNDFVHSAEHWVERGGFVTAMFRIKTLEGTIKATPGDWIIKGVKGEFYPCKPDIFEETYEAVAG